MILHLGACAKFENGEEYGFVNSDYVTQLEQRLADAEKVIEFYGDIGSWRIPNTILMSDYSSITQSDVEETSDDPMISKEYGGKTARAYKEKWK